MVFFLLLTSYKIIMRVCLIGASSLDVAPYIKKYALLLDRMGIDYEIITKEYSDTKKNSVVNGQIKVFYFGRAKTMFDKIIRFYRYAKFVNSVIKKGHYDKIVVFDPFHAALYYLVNGERFYRKCPFILDIRDYNLLLSNIVINSLLKRVMNKANLTVISSPRFKDWLPSLPNIITMHNLPNENRLMYNPDVLKHDFIKIAYLGGIGYYSENKKIVDTFCNDDKVILFYAGKYPDTGNIRDYCKSKKYTCIQFQGEYRNNDKYKLYEDVDIINAVYGNKSLVVTTALPNKLYDCIIYGIPIMVSSGTYLSEVVTRYNLGFCVDTEHDDIKAKLWEFYKEFDIDVFRSGREKCFNYLIAEQFETENSIKKFMEM